MISEYELYLSPEEAADDSKIREIIEGKVGRKIGSIRKIKQSIDARRSKISIRLVINVFELNEKDDLKLWLPDFPANDKKKTAVIAGFGPAGMFAALRLLELGIRPIVIERGKPVKERRRDLAVLNRDGIVDPDSNYCFGEGGAGTYSDGKLYTRSKKRGDVRKVLEIFVTHGADESILFESHPHIGTNKLPGIVEGLRETIIKNGGEVLFREKLMDIENPYLVFYLHAVKSFHNIGFS